MDILRRIRRNQNNEDGAAMLVVTCVMAIISILCLSLLLASYQMYATVNDEGRDEIYYRQAMSFSEVLKARLIKDRTLPGNKLDEGSVEEFIYSFMQDDENYTYENTAGETIKATNVSGKNADKYGTININLKKQSITTDDKKNEWSDSKESYLIVTIEVLADGEVRATTKMKFDYYYAQENYDYFYLDENDDQVNVFTDSTDSTKLLIDDQQVSLSTLKDNLGACTVNGKAYLVHRITKSGDTGFRLGFMGYY
ncbi:MAG: hypothetical protein K5656_12255 [Lachnospiraceae bacterium]|nr:hypothetical protein [Lachnospiraceae bacterium]